MTSTEIKRLGQTLADRLSAGALVTIVQDADEALALSEIRAGAASVVGCEPITVVSATDENATSLLEEHATDGIGTLVLCDFLAVYGANPVSVRLVRQVALQQREDGQFGRLVLLERTDTAVPEGLASDVEVVAPKLPTVAELQAELDAFLETQPEALKGNGETRYSVATAGAGLARHEFSRLLARSVIERGKLEAGWIRQEKANRIATKFGGALRFTDAEGADVGGLDSLREWLATRFAAFASQKAQDYGLPEPKGILIVGVPGCAKTLTAKAVARQNNLPLVTLQPGLLLGSLMGASEANTEQAIRAIDACAPAVCLIDEIEKGLSGLKSSGQGDSGTTKRQSGQLLSWLNDRTRPVFIVATANRVEDLPPELLRPGRFDTIFTVDLPTRDERIDIARIHLERRGRMFDPADVQKIGDATAEFSGAEIEQAIIDGMFASFEDGRELNVSDVLTAARERTPLAKTASEDIKRIRAWGASGRARPASKPAETSAGRPQRPPVQRRREN
jgi:hypothetical protein